MAGQESTPTGLTTSVRTVAELLHSRAVEQPDRLGYRFLVDGESDELHLTYADTDRRARAVAAALREAGARPGARALLVLPPGLDYLTTVFGCLYAGVVAVPVYPPDPFQLARSLPRLLAIVRDADPTVALTTAPLLGFLDEVTRLAPELGALRWVAVDDVPDGDQEEIAHDAPDATAVLQYTSGSTSDPRGVMLSHANLLHNSRLIQRLFRTTPDSHGLVWLPPYHDMGLIGGLLQPTYGGFPVTLMSPLSFLEDPMRWLRAIDRYSATASGGPNFAYDLCARKCTPEEAAQLDLRSWDVAFNGAEPVRPQTLERFAATFAPAGFRPEAFLPCYGLAEATLIVSGHGGRGTTAVPPVAVDRAALEQHRVAPPGAGPVARLTSCGPSAPDQRVVIVDPATSAACPPGRVGEIWVSGPSVAGGYWRQAAETARVFGAWIPGDEHAYLRTGDLGFLHDGQVVVTGRLKDLIIVRGQNHYPQDIELTAERVDRVLRPGCTTAFLVDERLVLVHEVRRGAEDVDVADLAGRIRQAVAQEHGLEVRTVVLVRAGGVPKTSSGKVQRRLCRSRHLAGELPEVGRGDAPQGGADDEPAVPAEQVLSATSEDRSALLESYLRGHLAAVTGSAPADRDQPLLAAGLDSLAVVQLKHRVDSELAVRLSLAAVLGGASLAGVVADLAGQLAAPDRPTGDAWQPAARRPDPTAELTAPMSFGQRWLWYLQTLEPATSAYTIAVALRLLDPVDGTALRRALDALVARHPMLRTTFQVRDGEPVQVIAPTGTAAYREHDAERLDDPALRTALTRAARAPFDLATGPLLRVDRYRRSAGDVLLLTMHHITTDFWSLTILAREVGELYDAYAAGREHTLPAPQATYVDAVEWQRSRLGDPAVAGRLEAYWDGQVGAGLPRLEMPAVAPGGHGGARHFALPPELAEKLRGQAATANVTLFVLLLAAFQTLLHRRTGQDDLVVGSGVAGRGRAEFTGVVGCFTSPVIVRSRWAAGEPFGALLARTQERVVGALEHQDYPMMMLASRRKITRRGPLFDVQFTFNRSPQPGDDLAALAAIGPTGLPRAVGSLRVESFPLPAARGSLPLELVMAEIGDVPHGQLRWHADTLDEAGADQLVEEFVALLWQVATEPLGAPAGVRSV